ncbi:hypothetical protein ACS0TY_018938 [Phlomoides rotata]
MDHDEEDNGVSGSVPEFGAIFMSNMETKKECLKRKIFALPPSMAEFVKHVKAGMLLFLFEYKRRQLFGVYQASSDGAIDIVPHGFKCSGRHYPAQVSFTQLWYCEPLSEIEFRDAIRENYFSAKKFKFGLSEDQVHRLLYLFSSRKLMNRPLSEANVEVACMDRRMLGDPRLKLSERGYMEPDENDEFSPTAFCDHHPNSFGRVKEDEVLVDDGVSEGRVHFYSDEDFLAKRRRLGNADKLMTNDVAENGIYNRDTHHTIGIYQIVSPKGALDEVRGSAIGCRLSQVERVTNNQVNNILNSSGYLVDPLDVRTNDDLTFMRRSRLFDEYKMHNGSAQAFASDRYAESLDTIKYPVQRDYNTHDTAKHLAYGDNDLNLRRQAREWIDDQECLMNRKLGNRYHMDCDGSPIGAYVHPGMHTVRKGAAAGRLPFNESEPDFGTCSLEGFSSEKNSHPLQSAHRNIHDRKYPIVERRINENDDNFCSTNLSKSAGYTGVDRQVVEDGMLRNNKRADNEEDRHMRTKLVTSMDYPSFSHKQNLSSFPEKLFPEKGLDHPRSMYNDSIITSIPYSPEHPDLSHGCFPPITANQNSSLVRENNPHHWSPGDFYSRFKDRLPQDLLEREKFRRPIDIAPEFGNQGFPIIIPGHKRSLLPESTRSFVKPNLPVHMDPSTSAPINYGGSLFSKLSPQHTDFENIGGENGLFAHPSKSRKYRFSTASQHGSQHVPLHEMDTLANKDLSCSEVKDFGVGISHPERDRASNEGQFSGYSSNMNLKELQKIPEAPHANSNVNRRSVFSRLSSKEESKFDEKNNEIDFIHPDCYMPATADEIMDLLQQSRNLSQRNLRQSRVGGQPTQGENAVHEKKSQCHIETNHSTMEVSRTSDASLAAADGVDDMPNETRVVDFKRRSDRKKFAGSTDDMNPHSKITCADKEVKNPVKTTLKRRKLVRPNFSKTGSATDAICSNETSQIPASILDKGDELSLETIISCDDAEMPNDTFHPTECSNNEHQIPEEQKEEVPHVFPSTSLELKGNNTTNVDLQIGSSQVLKETTQPGNSVFQVSGEGISAEVIDTTIPDLNLPGSYTEGSDLGIDCGNNYFEAKLLTKKMKRVIKRIKKEKMDSSSQ